MGEIYLDEGISIDSLSEKTGLTRSKTVNLLNKLKRNGRLRREGSKKGGRWVIVDVTHQPDV